MPAAARPSRVVVSCRVMVPAPFGSTSALRGEAGAVDLGAGARGNVDPGIAGSGLLGLAGAGMRGGLAVVLADGGDAEALLGLEGGRRGGTGARDQRQSDGRCDGGSDDEGCLHGGCSFEV